MDILPSLKIDQYLSIMEALPIEMALLDKDMCYLSMSAGWKKSYGLDDSVVGKCHYDIFSDIPERWREDHRYVLKTGKALSSELDSFIDNDGREHFLSWSVTPWIDDSGQVGGIIFITKNLTEFEMNKKRTEDAQKIARLGWWDFSLKTKEISWSPVMFELFPESIENGPPEFERHKSTIHPSDLGVWENAVNDAIEKDRPYSIIFRVIHPDKVVWVEATGKIQKDSKGQTVGLYGTCLEVTERELTLRNLERLNDELATFNYRASHDLRSPLTSVEGLASLCLDDLENGNIDEVKESLEQINELVIELKGTISDVLSLTKANYGKEDFSSIKSSNIESSLKKKFGILLKENNIELKLHHDWEQLSLPKSALRTIIENLVSNAIKYYDPQKEQSFIEVRSECSGDKRWVEFSVSDNGLGIPDEFHQKIFGMFEQFHTLSKGTGLGLYMIKKQVERFEGKISFTPLPQGSLFTFSLPCSHG